MIIQRYLVREVSHTFGAVLTVLVLVYVSNRFVKFLADAAAGEMAAGAILELLALKLLANMTVLVPLALYVAVLLALGRLHRDGEIVAMSAGGYGVTRLVRGVLWLGLGFAALCAVLSLYVTPASLAVAETKTREARRSTEVSTVIPGRFIEYQRGEDRVFYAESVSEDRRTMTRVFVHSREAGRHDVLLAERARYHVEPGERGVDERFLVLEDGRRYRGAPGSPDYSITEFERYAVRLEPSLPASGVLSVEALDTAALLASDRPPHAAELQWRLSLPISTVLLALLAVPLARAAPGQARTAKLFGGVLVYFIYTNVLSVATTSVTMGELPAAIGVWPVHAALALTIAVLLLGQERPRFWPRGVALRLASALGARRALRRGAGIRPTRRRPRPRRAR